MQARKEDLKFAIENNLAFAPAMRSQVTGLTDKEGSIKRSILEFAEEIDLKILTAKQLYELIIQ